MISVFVDTNILYCKNEVFDEVWFVKKLQDIIGDIEVNDIYSEVKILLPKMVINELYQQQLEAYESLRRQFAKIRMPNLQFNAEFDYGNYLMEIYKREIKDIQQGIVKVEIIDFPDNSKLEQIIDRAIKKIPPFEGKDKQSDKGFKDVIIWETIKEYKHKHVNDIVIFYCNDNLVASNELEEEFYNEFRDKIYIQKKDTLLKKLIELCDKSEIIMSFSNKIESRVRNCIIDDNEKLIELLSNDMVWCDGDEISDFDILNVDIIDCQDEIIYNKIYYNVEIKIKMYYAIHRDREMYKIIGKRQIDIYYDFDEDVLMTNSYDVLTMRRAELNNFFILENK